MVKSLQLTGLTDKQMVRIIACVTQSSSGFVKCYVANLSFFYCRSREVNTGVAHPQIGVKVETWNDET